MQSKSTPRIPKKLQKCRKNYIYLRMTVPCHCSLSSAITTGQWNLNSFGLNLTIWTSMTCDFRRIALRVKQLLSHWLFSTSDLREWLFRVEITWSGYQDFAIILLLVGLIYVTAKSPWKVGYFVLVPPREFGTKIWMLYDTCVTIHGSISNE